MRRTLLPALLLSLLASGCGHAAHTAQADHSAHAAARAHREAPAASEDAASPEGDEAAAGAASGDEAAPARVPGDFVAYRFSGSFRKEPVTLTQRVVAREGTALVIDLTLESGGEAEALRVRMSDAEERRGEVLSAARVDKDGRERPADIAAYEALMAKTALAADENEAELGAEDVTVDVGGAPLPCRKVSYRVRVGKSVATMKTIQSDAFAWGDVGGEITAEDGRVLYRAEVIGVGHEGGAAPKAAEAPRGAVATSDYDE